MPWECEAVSQPRPSFTLGTTPSTALGTPLTTLLSRWKIHIMPLSPTPTSHVPSGLQAICDVAKCCLEDRLVLGITVACGLSGKNGSLRENLRSAGAELDVEDGIYAAWESTSVTR